MAEIEKFSKKDRIIELWLTGEHDIRHISEDVDTKPSYVASVLQKTGYIKGYYDLYTDGDHPMNIYSATLKGQMGFKNIEAAKQSINRLEEEYRNLSQLRDRAGQHHCLVTALTLFNRARFIGKTAEADVFRKWIFSKMTEYVGPEDSAH